MDDTSKTQKENESYGKWEQGASRAIILWNALPVELQAMKSVQSFKAALRSHLKLI